MKHFMWLVVIVMGCGSNDGAPDIYPWNVSEEPVPTELWYDLSMTLPNGSYPNTSIGNCDFPFHASNFTNYRAVWLSIGGPFAQPVRQWFRCDQSYSHYKVDDNFQIICSRNSVKVFARDESTLTQLPAWLEPKIDWERAFRDRGRFNPHAVADFDLAVRTYNPGTGKILEYTERFQVLPNRFYTETAQPTGPVCLAEMSGIRMGVVDLTERCGTDTNCQSP